MEQSSFIEQLNRYKTLTEKLNGVAVGLLTGLKGQALGEFLKYLKECKDDEFILASDSMTIARWVLEKFEEKYREH